MFYYCKILSFEQINNLFFQFSLFFWTGFRESFEFEFFSISNNLTSPFPRHIWPNFPVSSVNMYSPAKVLPLKNADGGGHCIGHVCWGLLGNPKPLPPPPPSNHTSSTAMSIILVRTLYSATSLDLKNSMCHFCTFSWKPFHLKQQTSLTFFSTNNGHRAISSDDTIDTPQPQPTHIIVTLPPLHYLLVS